MSLIHSARLNGHDVYAYLKDILEQLPSQPRNLPAASANCSRIAGRQRNTLLRSAFHPIVKIGWPRAYETPGVSDVQDVRTRKMGDMIVVDAHIEVDAMLTVEAGHDIAVAARQRVLQRHRVLNLMTHVDPWRRPDMDHAPITGLTLLEGVEQSGGELRKMQ